MSLQGKTAVITGGGGCIGGSIARRLAELGAGVAVCDVEKQAAEKTAQEIEKAGLTASGFFMDVTDPSSVEAVFEEITRAFGGVDISIHTAGGSARIAGPGARYVPLVQQEDYVIDRVLKVNLYGALFVSRAAAARMIERGRGGRIINFSSIVGKNGLKTCVDYAAAKSGVMGMTAALAKELGEYGITVNSIAPGIVMRPEESGGEDRALRTNFLGQKCTARDVAELAAFMVSDEARFITGQTYIIDGGRSLAMKGTD